MIQRKRVGSARRSYVLETVERRLMLSAAAQPLVPLPVGWGGHPILRTQPFPKRAGTASDPTPADFQVGQPAPDPTALTPAQMRGAYGLTGLVINGINGTGAGQTIAIVDAYDDPNALADLNTFDAAYGLPAPPSFTKVNQQGQVINGGNAPRTDPEGPAYITGGNTWEEEESLDLQWAHAIAPDANLVLVETNSAGDLFTGVGAARNLPGVSVISMSWSGPEFNGETGYDSQYFTTPGNHQGITFVAATGDYGIFGNPGEFDTATVTPQYPDASPNVVSVGGTRLSVNPGNTYGSETGWGNGQASFPRGGSGGGISQYEPAPAYQTFVTGDVGVGQRVYPDVAMEGDPATGVAIVDTFDTGDPTVNQWLAGKNGGTSLATPMFAAVISIANQVRAGSGLTTLDGPSQTLPHLYELPDNAFHDITQGDNGYQAGVGYDLVTGRGSPNGSAFVTAMASNYIGYHVFRDANIDGIQDAGEAGVANVTVQLESTAGTVLRTTTTDADGFYQFLNPAVGTYLVHFAPLSGFQISPVGTTGPAVLQSTANPITGDSTVTISGNNGGNGTTDDPYANCGLFSETISITDATIQRPQSGTATMTFTVTINPASAVATFSVPYTTVDGTVTTPSTGPATVAHNDYRASTGTLVFAPGVTTETISVVIVGNTLIEKDLIFSVVLSPPPVEFDLVDSKTVGTGTIVNTSFPSVSITATAADTVTRSATVPQLLVFPVTLSAPAPFPVTVAYTTTDVTAVGSIDYTATTGTLTFTPDASGLTPVTQNITVAVLPGTRRQLDKQFALNVAAISGATTGSPSQVEGTILTNAPPAVNATGGAVTESLTGTALLPFQVEVAPSLSGPVTLNYATANGTAVAGVDYQAVSGTLTLAPGRIQQTVFVPVFRQFLSEMDKTLSFTISNPSVAIELVTPTVTGTIHYLPVTTLPITRGQKAVYTDTLGQRVSVGLTGPGSGTIVFLGTDPVATNAYELSFAGTTGASNVSVAVSGTGQTTVNSIVVGGSLNALSAKSVNVQQGVVTVSGTVNTLTSGYLSATAVTVGGAAGSRPLSVNIRRAVDTSITSAAPIRSLVAGAYINTTPAVPLYITAPSVGIVRVAGNFGGTIRSAGRVAALEVGGSITGGIEAGLGIGSVVADSLAGAVLTAGADVQTGTLADAAFSNANARIYQVHVRTSFSDSLIASSTVGRVTLGSIGSTTSGTPFGVVGSHITSVRTTTGGPVAVNVFNPTSQFKYQNFEVDLI